MDRTTEGDLTGLQRGTRQDYRGGLDRTSERGLDYSAENFRNSSFRIIDSAYARLSPVT